MLKFSVLSSGSKANCTYVTDGTTHLLVDCGLSAREATKRLGLLEVKAECLGILLVHFQLVGVQMLDRITQQLPAKALAPVLRVDKQHLDLASGNTGKPGDALVRVFGANQHHRVQVVSQHEVPQ